jgi:hypothetical protein
LEVLIQIAKELEVEIQELIRDTDS